MLFRQGILVCLVLLGGLTGCALSPQQLQPSPVITQSLPHVGKGQTVNLKVVDQRESSVIGTRGGLYSSTSNITVQANDVIPKLKEQAEKALTNMGYKPSSDGGSATLTIIIDSIMYTASDSNFSNDTSVKAVLRAQLQTPTKTYNGKYSSSVSEGFASAPDLETNNKLVAQVLSNALTSLFKDSSLTGSM